MNPNRKTTECEVCGGNAELQVVPDGFDDAPKKFTVVRKCSGGCKKICLADDSREDERDDGFAAYWMVKLNGFLRGKRFLILDRDRKFTTEFRDLLQHAGTDVIRLPSR